MSDGPRTPDRIRDALVAAMLRPWPGEAQSAIEATVDHIVERAAAADPAACALILEALAADAPPPPAGASFPDRARWALLHLLRAPGPAGRPDRLEQLARDMLALAADGDPGALALVAEAVGAPASAVAAPERFGPH